MKIFTIYTLILLIVLLTGCNKNRESTQSVIVDSTSIDNSKSTTVQDLIKENIPPMSGWKSYGLLGRVKSVKYTDGDYWEFNKDGNMTKKTTAWVSEDGSTQTNTVTNTYSSSNEYTVTNGTSYKIKIEYEKNTRNEIEQGGEYFRDSFTFDNLDRLIRYSPNMNFDVVTIEYKYKDETEMFPYKEIEEAGYEGGGGSYSTISTFEYLKTDTKGNWTERKVNCKISGVDGEDKKSYNTRTFSEIREITYY
ncbi:MAG: hypothetical protein ACK5M3_13205 [Dysgonomonas sp.]